MSVKKPAAKYHTVMLIDDSEIDNFINQKMIEGCNLAERIYVHSSAKSALEFLKNLKMMGAAMDALLPQIIFLDINMPIMDGFQFVNEFDKMGDDLKSKCQIIILTSSLNPADIESSKKSPSITRYVNKPLSKETLAGV